MTEAEFASCARATVTQLEMLKSFRELVREWNGRMNLVGPSFAEDFWRRHALDSAQLFHVEHDPPTWADVGSGAGFPGMVIAILLAGRPGAAVHLIESVGKKAAFLHQACRHLDVPAIVHHGRAEMLKPMPKVDVVTARACAPLSRLLAYTKGFMDAGARAAFLKGREVVQEMADARATWDFEGELVDSLSDPSGRILRIGKVSPRG